MSTVTLFQSFTCFTFMLPLVSFGITANWLGLEQFSYNDGGISAGQMTRLPTDVSESGQKDGIKGAE